jgi:hypothetical protein
LRKLSRILCEEEFCLKEDKRGKVRIKRMEKGKEREEKMNDLVTANW